MNDHSIEEHLKRAVGLVQSYGAAVLTIDGEVLSWNRGAATITGYPAAEAVDRPIASLIAPDDSVLTPQHLRQLAVTGSEEGGWLRRRDGSRFWGKVTVVADAEPDSSTRFTVFFRDATSLRVARDELERSRSMFEGILAIASDAVICIDDTQQIIFFNEGAERIFGYAPGEVLGQPLTILIPERFRDDHPHRIREFGQSPIVARQMGDRGEISGRRRDGEVFPAEASISKLRIGGGMIYTAVLRDITERRAAEEALARQADELARSNSELEQFAYVASHDLQEPLRMVASYTQLLSRRYSGRLDEEADEFIGFAVDGVTRMQALINDLLAFSRVGTRGAEFAPVPLDVVFRRVVASLGPTIEETGAQITADPLPQVRGDGTQLSQLFQNLIHNGLKFQRPGVAPSIHVGVEDGGEVWRLRISDNGIGIAPEFQERIFVIFQRLHSRSEYPGTGIGLAICKKIVERHGGRIWVESAENQGSTFHFTLPKDHTH